MDNIKQRTDAKGGSFYYEVNGKKLAEMSYIMAGENTMIIDHTDVDGALKGQGMGKKLQAALVDFVRANQIKVIPLCPFAKTTFEKTPEWHDILSA